MKILVATGLYPPEIGGPATHTEIIERELPKRGIEVSVVPFVRVRGYPKVIRHMMYFFLLLGNMRGVSLVYALDPVSVGLPALCAAKLMRKKFVLRVAGDYAWEQAAGRYGVTLFPEQFVTQVQEQAFVVRVLSYVERYVAHRADRVIVPSEYLKKIIVEWGIAPEDIIVIYTSFDATEHSRVKEENPEDRASLHIVSAGRLVPWKGMRLLIDVIADCSLEYPNIYCTIAGDGPEETALRTYTKERGMENRVRFVGRQSKAELATTLASASMFVLNTGYEGFSHQLLEVMAAGVPIVTTSVGGNIELISHEKEGLLVPYNDREKLKEAILRLARDRDLGASLVAGARTRVLSFTANRMVGEVQSVLTDIASPKSTT